MPLVSNQPQPNTLQTPGTPEGKRQKGTGFTNIRNLLQANLGAGGVMGATIGGGITQKAGQLKQDVQAAGQQFGQQYQQQKEKALGQGGTISTVGGLLAGQQDLSGLSPEEAERIGKQMRETQYTGPTQLTDYEAFLSRAGNLQALGTLAGMGGIGQGRLLQGTATRRGGYTRGQNLLDQYLVGQDVGAQEAIKQGATQAAGAAQQAQTGVNIAERQAQGLAQSIEAQKEATQKEVLKSLTGAQEEAGQSAKMYLQQADRIKKYLTGQIPKEQLNDEDKLALSELSKYGLNEATVVTTDPKAVDNLINAVANTINTQYTGQQRYLTEAQQKAARNLALLSGQQDIARKISDTEFDPQLFKDANKNIEAAVGQMESATKALETNLGWSGPEEAKKNADILNTALSAVRGRMSTDLDASRRGTPQIGDAGDMKNFIHGSGGDYLLSFPANSFWGAAIRYLGKDTLVNIAAQVEREDEGFLGINKNSNEWQQDRVIERVASALQNIASNANKLNKRYQSKMSLQDYIKKQAGIPIPSQQQGS